jgi:hypothetical protein
MFSTMSRKRWAGFLEGIDRIAQDALSKQWLYRTPVNDIRGPTQYGVNVKPELSVLEDPHRPAVVEFYQHINVAVSAGFPSRDRTEHCRVRHTHLPQLAFMFPKYPKDVVKACDHHRFRV